jgi:AbrB family looped-hinge helix DNA binding protein
MTRAGEIYQDMANYRTVVGSNGRIVIPAALRQPLGLVTGTRIHWIAEGTRLILSPMTEKRIDQLMGCLKPGPGEKSMVELLFTERRREREREDKKFRLAVHTK